MNCKQLDELLPLYAGRDLDEKRARLVSEHVQICSTCAQVAGEYRDTVELAQHFAPPVFTDNVYASVRRQVMQQIKDEPSAPLLPQMFVSWFRPRTTWAIASAVVVAVAALAFYFVINRDAANRPIAINQGTVSHNERGPSQGPEAPATASAAPSATSETDTPRHSKPKRVHNLLRTSVIATNGRNSAEPNSLPVNDSVPERTLRVEIQTKDPNIRIIWFSQSNSKPALPNSKGI
jgi:hypothetical protein